MSCGVSRLLMHYGPVAPTLLTPAIVVRIRRKRTKTGRYLPTHSAGTMRLFIALNLPEAVRALVFRAPEPLREKASGVRWSRPENLHLTIRFLGEVDAEVEENLSMGLDVVAGGAPRISIRFERFGAFPSPERPRVIWLGVEATSELRLLRERVQEQLASAGVPPDTRPFRPHVALGRVKSRDADIGWGLIAGAARPDLSANVCVETLDLVRSHLTQAGPRYEILHRAALGMKVGGREG